VATRDDVGTPKASCLKKHFSMIYPECKIEARVQLYDPSAEDEILSGQPDFVLDCIDNIDTKVTNIAEIILLPNLILISYYIMILAFHAFRVFLKYLGVPFIFHVIML
jgi:tRNA A37 threonylcarbamoyladenosine dehydratase